MARIRTIKPELAQSLDVASWSLLAQALWPRLFCHVDDDGRCVYDPRLLSAALAPLMDDCTPTAMADVVKEWESTGSVVTYDVDGRTYLAVANFGDHQRINRKTDSDLPPPPSEPSTTTHEHLSEDVHREVEGNREQGREQGVSSSDLRPDHEWATDDTDVETVRATANEVAKLIADNGHPLPGKGTKASVTWLVEMDRLLRLGPPGQTTTDPPTPDDVIEVARWATSDEFWRGNIASIPKLRAKWSQLALKARDGPKNGSPTGLEAVVAASRRAG